MHQAVSSKADLERVLLPPLQHRTVASSAGAPQGHLCLRRLCCTALCLLGQVQQRHRLAFVH